MSEEEPKRQTVASKSGWEVKDKTWEEMQKRTFTRWVNAQLRKRGLAIESLSDDFRDGTKLIALYEIISDSSLGKYVKKPRLRVQQIANLNLVVPKINEFVGSVGIRVEFSPEEICDGEIKMILGMIWCLIHKFSIQDITEAELNAREGLLLWCQRKTKPYDNVNIENFNRSWQDGLGFCALIHAHHPDLIDYENLSKSNPKDNLELAFKVADEKLDIPSLLDAEDMVSVKPDDKSVMTYVAQYWKKFASKQKEQTAGDKVANIANRQRSNQEMQNDYEERARQFVQWVDQKTEEFQNRDFGNCLEDVQPKFDDFTQYKENDKPPKTTERLELEGLLSSLRMKQKNEGSPVYEPPEELSQKNIDLKWNQLNQNEKEYEDQVREELQKQKRLAKSLARFRARAKKLRSWTEEKKEYLNNDQSQLDSIAACSAALKIHDAFENECEAMASGFNVLKDIGQEIIDAEHKAKPEVEETLAELNGSDEEIKTQGRERKEKIESALTQQKEIDEKCLEFATKAAQFNLAAEDANLMLTDPVASSSVAEAEGMASGVQEASSNLQQQKESVEALKQLNEDLEAAGVTENPYTRVQLADIESDFESISAQLSERENELNAEKEKQARNEQLVQEYSDLASAFAEFVEQQKDALSAEQEGDLEEQLSKYKEMSANVLEEAENKFEAIREKHSSIEEAQIAERLQVPFQNVRVQKDSLSSLTQRKQAALERLIEAKKSAAVTPEQLEEIKNTFTHFDKDSNKELNRSEFKACLASMGEDVSEEAVTEILASLGLGEDDTLNFDTFVAFMSNRMKKGDSKEDILDAFKVIAGDKDFVTEADMRRVMDDEQVSYLTSVMPKSEYDEQGYDFNAYADTIYA
eukprot:gb/GECH01011652.1/.p1 GENE.gb/GECH01011652.1/~~gb/GECH01011652.1/.p1  ORF type:complete len:868 (+),score=306.88 gb/GECH01011652.1/:1-2604(+)